MNNENLIVLYDEDGNEVPFEFLDYIEYDHCNYVALLPLEGDMENAEVLILQVVENEDGEQDFDIVGINAVHIERKLNFAVPENTEPCQQNAVHNLLFVSGFASEFW
ncbi:MAG: DUF1292 domain-containing protein, partial [Clostridia bacterium]|nr:DUF1292 domain-containing protein [Clostridia bacterium]